MDGPVIPSEAQQIGLDLGALCEQTMALYSQILDQPQFTPQILMNPPFRFLHEVFVALMQRTGWGQGLLQGEELMPQYYADSLER